MQAGIGAITVLFSYFLVQDIRKNKDKISDVSWTGLSFVGAITIFFDTLGIGCYAPQTAIFKFFKLVPDRLIPGTLNTCCVLPMAAEAIIFITIIKVEPITLFSMIIASSIGAIIGAGFVAKLPEKKIQLGMGIALLIVAFTIAAGQLGLMPVGGEEIGLTGLKLLVAVVVSFILGALMTIGIGCYAPMMALVYALGMSPRVSFPIMMGSCAFLIPSAGIKFIKEGAYDIKANIAINLAGLVGVVVAAYIVKELPLTILKWLIVCVILYTSVAMLRSAFNNESKSDITPTA
ncbi:MAG: sulfite exporter TauE/SafE family protein [Dehalobacterium sp.]